MRQEKDSALILALPRLVPLFPRYVRHSKLQRNSLTTLPYDLFDGMDRLGSV